MSGLPLAIHQLVPETEEPPAYPIAAEAPVYLEPQPYYEPVAYAYSPSLIPAAPYPSPVTYSPVLAATEFQGFHRVSCFVSRVQNHFPSVHGRTHVHANVRIYVYVFVYLSIHLKMCVCVCVLCGLWERKGFPVHQEQSQIPM